MIDSLRRHYPAIEILAPGCVVVGGAVRDALLGLVPGDLDVSCRAARETARTFAFRTDGNFVALGTGRHTTWRVVVGDRDYDFSERSGATIEDDLERRDFTINALALTLDGRLIDPFGGADDLVRRRIRVVRESNLDEDPLRLLKAVRMVATLDFEIEAETADAIRQRADAIRAIPGERVSRELDLILASRHRGDAVLLMVDLDLADALDLGIDAETVNLLRDIESDDLSEIYSVLALRWPASEIATRGARLRWSRDRIRVVSGVVDLVSRLQAQAPDDEGALAVLIYDAGREVSRAAARIVSASGLPELSDRIDKLIDRIPNLFEMTALLTGDEIRARYPNITGIDIGEIKRMLLEAQIRGEISDRETAWNLSEKRIGAAGQVAPHGTES